MRNLGAGYGNQITQDDPPLIKNFKKVQESRAMKMSSWNRAQEKKIWKDKREMEKYRFEDLLRGRAKKKAIEHRLNRRRRSRINSNNPQSLIGKNIFLEKY